MPEYTYMLTAAGIIALSYAIVTLGVWTRDREAERVLLVLAFLAMVPAAVAGPLANLSLPAHYRFMAQGDLTVLGYKAVVNEGIYVLVDEPAGPRFYRLPWNPNTAKMLEDMRRAGKMAQMKKVRPWYEPSLDMKPPVAMPPPQPKFLPDKMDEGFPPPATPRPPQHPEGMDS